MVSIIIPCYNAQKTLGSTITSVLNQDDKNWEIIAVDDGSNDSTLEMLTELANNDNRIKVIHQHNMGVSAARNNGLKHSSGQWVYFLDSDDLISPNLVSSIKQTAIIKNVIIFNFIETIKSRIRYHKITNLQTVYSDYLVNKQSIHISSMAFRRDFLIEKCITFDENTYYGEDREFISNIFLLNPNIQFINKELFTYVLREGSAMTKKIYNAKRFSSVLACERTYLKLRHTTEAKAALTILVFTITRHLKMFHDYECTDPALKSKLYSYYNRYLKSFRWYGWSKVQIYTTVAGYLSHIKYFFNLFLKFS